MRRKRPLTAATALIEFLSLPKLLCISFFYFLINDKDSLNEQTIKHTERPLSDVLVLIKETTPESETPVSCIN